MKLYHGTSETIGRLALTEGLKPRIVTGAKSTWERNESAPEYVYLTRAYALYFAYNAVPLEEGNSDKQFDHKWAVVEVDTDLLDDEDMRPDEDFLEQASRGQEMPDWCEGLDECKTMETRTEWFRDNLHWFQHMWDVSVDKLGNAAHAGTIPPEAITRVALYTPKSNDMITTMALDPTITLVNYMIMGQKYRNLIDWLFGQEFPVEEWDPIIAEFSKVPDRSEAMKQMHAKRLEVVAPMLLKRDGIEIIKGLGFTEPGQGA